MRGPLRALRRTPEPHWEVDHISPGSLRAQQQLPNDPLYQWRLVYGSVTIVVKWGTRHGWDAYCVACGSYLPGKLSGPDQAYEDEGLAKRAAMAHAREKHSY